MNVLSTSMSTSPARLSRLAIGLPVLQEATTDANEQGGEKWDFAVSTQELFLQGLTGTDLRWMLARGLLEQAVEKPLCGGKRVFQTIAGLSIVEHSCFVLTQAGCVFAEQLAMEDSPATHQPTQKHIESDLPHWDSDARDLTWREYLIKKFRTPAQCQEMILTGFEKARWVRRIDNPLPDDTGVDPHHQLRDAIRRLNCNQIYQKIHFSRDGYGRGICWEII